MISLAFPTVLAEQAVCGQVDPELFFPEKGSATKAPKDICAVCPVRVECLDWALANDVRHGVWGGLSDNERRRLRRRAGDVPPTPAPAPAAVPKAPRQPVQCGTRPGYQKHRRNGEQACDPCRQANTDADNRLRRTGTTKAAA